MKVILNSGKFLLAAVLALSACSSLPRPDKLQKPAYLDAIVSHNETLGEYYELVPAFKVILPATAPRRLSYLESQVAEFSRMKLFKYSGYGADQAVATNDAKAMAEELARSGRTTKVLPETLTISAKYVSGKKPRITIKAAPAILDEDGALHFSLTEYSDKEALKQPGDPARGSFLPGESAAETPDPKTPSKEASAIRSYLQKRYGKSFKVKRSATVVSKDGKPVAGVDVELTFFPESARIVFDGTVKNMSGSPLWATYYLPQLTYHKGRDWFTFTSKRFGDSMSEKDRKQYHLRPGAEKGFQFTTDPELKVLVYDSVQKRIAPKNAFSSKEADDLLKLEIIEKYMNKSSDVLLEIFPERVICADCGVKLY